MSWRVAKSLNVLLDQINAAFPTRNRSSDGSIGDANHQSRVSDHNPWYGPGIVTARDFTHDPAVGLDMDRLTDQLQASRDRRIKYCIFNRWIMDSRFNAWRWVRYTGPNPHTTHMHLSVMPNPSCDDTRPWHLPMLGGSPAPPPPSPTLPAHPVGSRVLVLRTPHMTGTDVLALQRVLNRWYPSLPPLAEDGVYGPATTARVRYLQQHAGITVDGHAGRQTFGVLHMA